MLPSTSFTTPISRWVRPEAPPAGAPAASVDAATRLCWVHRRMATKAGSEAATTNPFVDYVWPAVYYHGYGELSRCCAGRIGNRQKMEIALRVYRTATPAVSSSPEDPSSDPPMVVVARLLGAGADDRIEYVEVGGEATSPRPVFVAFTEWATDAMTHLSHPEVYREHPALYLEFMKGIDEAFSLLLEGEPPSQNYFRMGERRLELFHENTGKMAALDPPATADEQADRDQDYPDPPQEIREPGAQAHGTQTSVQYAPANEFDSSSLSEKTPTRSNITGSPRAFFGTPKALTDSLSENDSSETTADDGHSTVRLAQSPATMPGAPTNQPADASPRPRDDQAQTQITEAPEEIDEAPMEDAEESNFSSSATVVSTDSSNVPATPGRSESPGGEDTPAKSVAECCGFPEIKEGMTFKQVKTSLLLVGWQQHTVRDEIRYFLPGKEVAEDAVLGRDFFNEESLAQFIAENFDWALPDALSPTQQQKDADETSADNSVMTPKKHAAAENTPGLGETTPGNAQPSKTSKKSPAAKKSVKKRKTRGRPIVTPVTARRSRRNPTPRTECKPAALLAYTNASLSEKDDDEFYNFITLIDLLQRKLGWTYRKASNNLKPWVYERVDTPGEKGGIYGVDYFYEEDEVLEYCRQNNYKERYGNKPTAVTPPTRKRSKIH